MSLDMLSLTGLELRSGHAQLVLLFDFEFLHCVWFWDTPGEKQHACMALAFIISLGIVLDIPCSLSRLYDHVASTVSLE